MRCRRFRQSDLALLNDANAIDTTRDLIWFKLGDAYRSSAPKQSDPDEKKKRYETAAADFRRRSIFAKVPSRPQKDP